MQLMVVGGSDAGISAGLRARELDPTVEVTVLVADRFPNFSICGLPYHVSGDVPDWHQLAHRSLEDLEATGMRLLLDHTAHRIDPAVRQITVTGPRGHKQALGYDRLVVGTGAVPARPPIPGLDLPGVHLLHSMADVFAVQQAIKAGQPRRAVIVGAGGRPDLEARGPRRPANAGGHQPGPAVTPPDSRGGSCLICPEGAWYPRPAGWSWAADRGRP